MIFLNFHFLRFLSKYVSKFWIAARISISSPESPPQALSSPLQSSLFEALAPGQFGAGSNLHLGWWSHSLGIAKCPPPPSKKEIKKSPPPQDQADLYFWILGNFWQRGEEEGEGRAAGISSSVWRTPSVSQFQRFAFETLSSTAACLQSFVLGPQIIFWQLSYFKQPSSVEIYNWKSFNLPVLEVPPSIVSNIYDEERRSKWTPQLFHTEPCPLWSILRQRYDFMNHSCIIFFLEAIHAQ